VTLEEIQKALDELKRSSTPNVTFAYKNRRMLRWQPLALAGLSEEEAKAFAEANDMYYVAKWLVYSVDGGVSWIPVPAGKDIPVHE